MYLRHHVKYPLFLSNFSRTLLFIDKFSKNTQTSNFMKILSVGTDLHADGRAEGT
jgi:hypothetical protein